MTPLVTSSSRRLDALIAALVRSIDNSAIIAHSLGEELGHRGHIVTHAFLEDLLATSRRGLEECGAPADFKRNLRTTLKAT